MHCKKCQGRMFIDRTYSDNKRMDVYCILCGRRKFVSKYDNAFGAFLSRAETGLSNAYLA